MNSSDEIRYNITKLNKRYIDPYGVYFVPGSNISERFILNAAEVLAAREWFDDEGIAKYRMMDKEKEDIFNRLSMLKVDMITSSGKYFDYESTYIHPLNIQDIYLLRKLYRDSPDEPMIARDVEIVVKSKNNSKPKVRYKITRDQKYNDGLHQLKMQFLSEFKIIAIIGGITVCLLLGSGFWNSLNSANKYDSNTNYATTYQEPVIVIDYDEYTESETKKEEEINREDMIKKICNIYHVNYDIVYDTLVKLTDNFCSEGYIDGKIEGVSCKGAIVEAQSEEELLTYIVRVIKQDPTRWNVETTDLYVDNGYESGDDYCEQIEHVAEVLRIDKYLLYAIVQSECGFSSELFLNYNNPAGIKNDSGDWWHFDTKEEGFLELGMELLKYYRWIGEPSNSVDEETIAKIRDIHAPLSDGNQHWLINVLDRMNYARVNSEELFGDSLQSNGLSH